MNVTEFLVKDLNREIKVEVPRDNIENKLLSKLEELKNTVQLKGFRPGKVIRIRPESWPLLQVPREEYIHHNRDGIDIRFPTPDIFQIIPKN